MKVKRLRSLFGVFIMASAVALFVRLFVLEDYRIVSSSMSPGLLKGDLVFVTKSTFNLRLPFSTYELFRFRSPRRGEVVAFTLPGKDGMTYVKRVVALGGDRFEVREGRIFVNGTAAVYSPVGEARSIAPSDGLLWESLAEGERHQVREDPESDYGPIDIPKDHFFAMGDNRPESVDGRSWGPVPQASLKGRVARVWMSLDDTGSIRPGRAGLPFP